MRYYLGAYPTLQKAVAARKEAERRIHDPENMESIGDLTAETKARFLAYLRETGLKINDPQDQTANVKNDTTHKLEEEP